MQLSLRVVEIVAKSIPDAISEDTIYALTITTHDQHLPVKS